jgi:hypothetical protein
VAEAVGSWLAIARRNWESVVTAFRGSTIRSTILGAFPHPWWLLAALGFLASRRVDREWTLAVVMAGLLPTVVMLALLSLPRVAFFIYPAIVLLAARGALVLGGLAASAVGRAWPSPRLAGLVATVVVGLTLGGLALLSNADLLGYQELNARFHHALRGAW